MNIERRKYQEEVWETLQKVRSEGRKRALIHLATGLGKTTVAAIDVGNYLAQYPEAKVLFVSHMTDICEQARGTFLELGIENSIEFITFQYLYRHLTKISANKYDYIIWDEAHHIEAETFSAVRDHFHTKFELGLTATPERADGLDILKYFGDPVYAKGLGEGIGEGWLSAVDYHIVFDEAVKKAIGSGFNAKTLTEIRDLFAVRVRNEVIAKEVLDRRHAIGLDLAKTIVFCKTTTAAEGMAKLLGGVAYHSGIEKKIREQTLSDFRDGSLQVICTVDMFNEGIDIPDARLVVFLRSTSSRTIFEQQLGRGLRRHEGKTSVTILDFVANVERIDFVRELGHTVSKHRGKEAYNGKNRSGGTTKEKRPAFYSSSFEFEDKAIELLKRYQAIKDIEYLTTDEVVKAYKKLGSAPKAAKHFSVTSSAIYKHLKRAGISYGHTRPELTAEIIAEVYYRVKSTKQAADELGVSSSTVVDRLQKAGYTLLPRQNEIHISDDEILRVYEASRSIRAAATTLKVDRYALAKKLRSFGIETDTLWKPNISKQKMSELYKKFNGDIIKMAQHMGGKRHWVDIYKALITYGYIDNPPKPITSAQAAAAYYKYGTTKAAAEALGVSAYHISRLSTGARYIPKYGRKQKQQKKKEMALV